MSLLNDALRKKDSEGQSPSVPLESLAPAPKKKKKIYLLSALVVLCVLGGTALVALNLFFLEDQGSLIASAPQRIEAKRLSVTPPAAPAVSEPPLAVKLPAKAPATKKVETVKSSVAQHRVAKVVKETKPVLAAEAKKDTSPPKPRAAGAKKTKTLSVRPLPASPVSVADSVVSVRAKVQPVPASQVQLPAVVDPGTDFSASVLSDGMTPFFEKGQSYQAESLHKKSIVMYRTVLDTHPEHRESLFRLASAQIESGAYGDAYATMVRLHALDNSNPKVLINKAVAAIGSGMTEQALADLKSAERLGGSAFDIHLHKGVALSRSEKLRDAIASYRKAETIQPQSQELVLNLAVALDKNGDHAEALDYYGTYLGMDISAEQQQQVRRRYRTLRLYLDGLKG